MINTGGNKFEGISAITTIKEVRCIAGFISTYKDMDSYI